LFNQIYQFNFIKSIYKLVLDRYKAGQLIIQYFAIISISRFLK